MLAHAAPLDEALALHQRLRFDPAQPAADQQQRLAALAAELAAALKHPAARMHET
jgi:hypothetical protein